MNIGTGNTINSDMWSGYNFLDGINSGYVHITSNHSISQFDLTARIESMWDELKSTLKKMYITIPSKNFLYFLREAEYRWNIKSFTMKEKINDFVEILSSIKEGDELLLLNEEELKEIEYETFYDDD